MKSKITRIIALLAAVCGLQVFGDSDVISVNFATNQNNSAIGSTTSEGIVAATGWNDENENASSDWVSINSQNGKTASVSWSASTTWGNTNPSSKLVQGYLDDGEKDSHNAQVKFKGVTFTRYDVYIYAGLDNSAAYCRPYSLTIGTGTAVDYTCGSSGIAYQGSTSWGKGSTLSSGEANALGKNVMCIQNISGEEITIDGKGSGTGRGGIAAIQIVERTDSVTEVGSGTTQTITSGTTGFFKLTGGTIDLSTLSPTGKPISTITLDSDSTGGTVILPSGIPNGTTYIMYAAKTLSGITWKVGDETITPSGSGIINGIYVAKGYPTPDSWISFDDGSSTVVGTTTFSLGSPSSTELVVRSSGVGSNKAMVNSGTHPWTDASVLGDAASSGFTAFVSAKAVSVGESAPGAVVCLGKGNSHQALVIAVGTDGSMEFGDNGDGGDYVKRQSFGNNDVTKRYHSYAITVKSDKTVQLYLDGQKLSTTCTAGALPTAEGFQLGNIHGGTFGNSPLTDLRIEDFKLFKSVLTDDQIAALANDFPAWSTVVVGGTTPYDTIQDAMTAAGSDGTVTLVADTEANVDTATSYAGALTGSFNLTKKGSAALTLTGANTISGALKIDEGSVIASTGSLGTGAITVAEGASLKVKLTWQQVIDGYTFSNTLTNSGTFKYVLPNNSEVDPTDGNSYVANPAAALKYGYAFNDSTGAETGASDDFLSGASGWSFTSGVYDKARDLSNQTGSPWGSSFSWPDGNFTMIVVAKAPQDNGCFFAMGGSAGTTGLIGMRNAGDNTVKVFTASQTDTGLSVTFGDDPKEQFHTYAIVYDCTNGNLKWSVDGLAFSDTVDFTAGTGTSWQFGGIFQGGYSGWAANSSQGAIDEFRVYKGELSLAQIQAIDKDFALKLRANVTESKNFSELTWTHPGLYATAIADTTSQYSWQLVNTAADATVTLDDSIASAASFAVQSETGKALTLAKGSGAAIAVTAFDFSSATGDVTVDFDTGAATIASGTHTILTGDGTGAITVPASDKVSLKSDTMTAGSRFTMSDSTSTVRFAPTSSSDALTVSDVDLFKKQGTFVFDRAVNYTGNSGVLSIGNQKWENTGITQTLDLNADLTVTRLQTVVGRFEVNTINQNSGTVTANGTADGTGAEDNSILFGNYPGTSTYNLNNGSIVAKGAITVGSDGSSTLNVGKSDGTSTSATISTTTMRSHKDYAYAGDNDALYIYPHGEIDTVNGVNFTATRAKFILAGGTLKTSATAASITVSQSDGMQVTAASVVAAAAGTTLTINPALTGTGSLTIGTTTDTGTVVFSNTGTTLSGSVTITEGATLRVPMVTDAATYTVGGAGTLKVALTDAQKASVETVTTGIKTSGFTGTITLVDSTGAEVTSHTASVDDDGKVQVALASGYRTLNWDNDNEKWLNSATSAEVSDVGTKDALVLKANDEVSFTDTLSAWKVILPDSGTVTLSGYEKLTLAENTIVVPTSTTLKYQLPQLTNGAVSSYVVPNSLSGDGTVEIAGLSTSAWTDGNPIANDKLTNFTGTLHFSAGQYKLSTTISSQVTIKVTDGAQAWLQSDSTEWSNNFIISGQGWATTGTVNTWDRGAIRVDKNISSSSTITCELDDENEMPRISCYVAATVAAKFGGSCGVDFHDSATLTLSAPTTQMSGLTGTVKVSEGTLKIGSDSGGSAGATMKIGDALVAESGTTIILHAWTTAKATFASDDKVSLTTPVTLNSATLTCQDGAHYVSDLTVTGTSKMSLGWQKGWGIGKLHGAAGTELDATTSSDDNDTTKTYFTLDDGDFAGTLKIKNTLDEDFWFSPKGDALANATLKFEKGSGASDCYVVLRADTVIGTMDPDNGPAAVFGDGASTPTLTIKGGTIAAIKDTAEGGSESYKLGLVIDGDVTITTADTTTYSGSVTINGGESLTLTTGDTTIGTSQISAATGYTLWIDTDSVADHTVYSAVELVSVTVANVDNATVVVKVGGKTVSPTTEGGTSYSVPKGATITATYTAADGYFPVSTVKTVDSAAEGAEITAPTITSKDDAVATIGSGDTIQYFATLQEAVEAANAGTDKAITIKNSASGSVTVGTGNQVDGASMAVSMTYAGAYIMDVAITVAANTTLTLLPTTGSANCKYTVTGADRATSKVVMSPNYNMGLASGSAFRRIIFESAGLNSAKLYLEQKLDTDVLFDETVDFVAGSGSQTVFDGGSAHPTTISVGTFTGSGTLVSEGWGKATVVVKQASSENFTGVVGCPLVFEGTSYTFLPTWSAGADQNKQVTFVGTLNNSELEISAGNAKKDFVITNGADITAKRLVIGNQASTDQKITQTGGTVTLVGEGTGKDKNSTPFLLGHWSGNTRAYTITGGEFYALNGVTRLGWDGGCALTVGGGTSTATMKLKGLRGGYSSDTYYTLQGSSTLTVAANGVLAIGDGGLSLGSDKSVPMTMTGGMLLGYTDTTIAVDTFTVSGAATIAAAADTTMLLDSTVAGEGAITIGTTTATGTVKIPETAVLKGHTITIAEGAHLAFDLTEFASVAASTNVLTLADDATAGRITLLNADKYPWLKMGTGDDLGKIVVDTTKIATGLHISRICPKPAYVNKDPNGRTSGWIELSNYGNVATNLNCFKIVRANMGKEFKASKMGTLPDCTVEAGATVRVYTSEDYPTAEDHGGTGYEVKRYGTSGTEVVESDTGIIVIPTKVNPKKFPMVRLYDADGKTVIDEIVVPADIDDDDIVNATTTPTKLVRSVTVNGTTTEYGPDACGLFGVKNATTDIAQQNTRDGFVPTGADCTISFAVNPFTTGSAEPLEDNAIESVTLEYRTFSATAAMETKTATMTKAETADSTKGWVYTGAIPSVDLTAGALVQYRAKIVDAGGKTWYSPRTLNRELGHEWYGFVVQPTVAATVADTTGICTNTLQTILFFGTSENVTQMDKDINDQDTSVVPNGARLAVYDTQTHTYYDNVRFDLRGQTSANFVKRSHGLRFNKIAPFACKNPVDGEEISVRKTSFLAEYGDPTYIRQALAFWVMRQAGVDAPFEYPVRLYLNGEFYQLAFHSIRFTDEYIEDYLGLNGNGYAYKNTETTKANTSASGTGTGCEKKTPDDDNETDMTVLNSYTADFGTTDKTATQLNTAVMKKFDLPKWINYLAATKITQEADDVWTNLGIYINAYDAWYNPDGDDLMRPIAYDQNLSFGQWYYSDDTGRGQSGIVATNDYMKSHPFYGGAEVLYHLNDGSVLNVYGGTTPRYNFAMNAVLQNATYRTNLVRRIRTLMDKVYGSKDTAQADTPIWKQALVYKNLIAADVETDHTKWDYANIGKNDEHCQDIWVWATGSDAPAFDAAFTDLWENYLAPRREHLYVRHSADATIRSTATGTQYTEVGYASDKAAGIPEAQSATSSLTNLITVTTNNVALTIQNDNAEAIDLSGWKLDGYVTLTLEPGTVVAPNSALYVVADKRAYVNSSDYSADKLCVVGDAVHTNVTYLSLSDTAGNVVVMKIGDENKTVQEAITEAQSAGEDIIVPSISGHDTITVTPGSVVTIANPQESDADKITVQYTMSDNTVTNLTAGSDVSVAIKDGVIDITPTVTPTPTAMSGTDAGKVTVDVTPVPGLFYQILTSTDNKKFSASTASDEGASQATGTGTKTLTVTPPAKDAKGNKPKVIYFKVEVKATK